MVYKIRALLTDGRTRTADWCWGNHRYALSPVSHTFLSLQLSSILEVAQFPKTGVGNWEPGFPFKESIQLLSNEPELRFLRNCNRATSNPFSLTNQLVLVVERSSASGLPTDAHTFSLFLAHAEQDKWMNYVTPRRPIYIPSGTLLDTVKYSAITFSIASLPRPDSMQSCNGVTGNTKVVMNKMT